jgi:hypothetical protein
MAELRTVQWEDISRDADSLFRVWTDGRELQWAKKSWQALSARGLTSYAGEVERTSVLIKLIALADIYREFCDLAFNETHEQEHAVWASELSLELFRVAQCVGPQFECDEDADNDTLLDRALCELVMQGRPAIYAALKAEFGDDSLLFVSLWSTADCEKDENDSDNGEQKSKTTDADAEIDWTEDAYWILNTELTGEKQRAFNWVREGFCS